MSSDPQWDFNRPLPHDQEAERAVIGAALLTGEIPPDAQDLQPSDFYSEIHAQAWKAMKHLAAEGHSIEPHIVTDVLSRTAGSMSASHVGISLARLLDEQWKNRNIAYYSRIVREKAILRKVIFVFHQFASQAYRDGAYLDGLLSGYEGHLKELRERSTGQERWGFPLNAWDLSKDAMEREDKVDWIIEPIMAAPDVGSLVGDGGVGKSKLAAGMALSVAFGKPLWGHFSVPSQGRVIYINEERPDLTRRHLHSLAPGLGIDPAEIEKRIFLMGRGSKTWRVTDVDAVQALLQYARQLGDVKLIIWDSLHVLHDKDENDNAQMTEVIEGFRRMCMEIGCCGLIIHHTRKNDFGDSGLSARGATAIKDTVDAQFLVRCQNREEPGQVRVVQDKTRRSLVPPFLLNLDHNGRGDITSIEWIGKAPSKVDEALEAALEVINGSSVPIKSGEIALKLADRFRKDTVYKALERVRKETLAPWRKGKPQGFEYGSGEKHGDA